MILYSVTVSVDKNVELEWLTWMKEEYIPKVLETGKFKDNKIFKLLGDQKEDPTYSLQYFAETLDDLDDYLSNHAPKLIQEHNEMFKNRHVAFRTVLQEIDFK